MYASICLSLSAFFLEVEQFKLSPQYCTQIMPRSKKTREEWKGGTEACKDQDISECVWALNVVHFLIYGNVPKGHYSLQVMLVITDESRPAHIWKRFKIMNAHLIESSISHFKGSDSLLHKWCVLMLSYSKDINNFTLITDI